MTRLVLIAAALLSLSACTDATLAGYGALGSSGDITCYSGGKVIYQGRSTGRIETEAHSDGWNLKDSSTGKFVRVSGDCVIQN